MVSNEAMQIHLNRAALRDAAIVISVLALIGCSTPKPSAPAPPAATPAETPAATPAEKQAARSALLAIERPWLTVFFKGTPVVIALRAQDALRVEVPLSFSFDAGRAQVKPPLAAVLDKVSESLRRVPLARVELLAAPGDVGGSPALAQQRAEQVRAYLLARGVPASQLGQPTSTTTAAVQLRLEVVSH